MLHNRIRWLWYSSLIIVILSMQTGSILSQDDENDYVGTRECRSCHRSYTNDHEETVHFRTLIEVEEALEDDFALEDIVLASFEEDSEDIRLTEYDEPRPFTVEDIVFTLGAGRHYQAYITDVDGVLRVLPAQWHIEEETWTLVDMGEDWLDPAYEFASQCAGCHTTNFNAEDLVWDEAGVQCEACHGPGLIHVEFADDAGSSISDDEYTDLSIAINFSLDSQVCGQCHIRGTHDATGLPFPVGYHPGMDLLDESVFTPVSSDDTEAWFTTVHARQPNMQFNEWLQSSHGNALESAQDADNFDASCLGCHSVAQRRVDYLINEDWVDEDEFDPLSTLDVHGFGITCASCHNPHEVNEADFLIDEPYALCINCHSNGEDTDGIHHPVQEVFEGLDLIEAIEPIEGIHFSSDEGPDCLTCHMQGIETKNGIRQSHTFHPISPAGAAEIDNLQDSCTSCHTDIENPEQMQQLIDSIQGNVTDRINVAQQAISDDTPQWVAQAIMVIEGDGSRGIHNFGYTNAMLKAVEFELGIVASTLSDADVAQLVADSLPEPQVTETPLREPIVPPVGGLTGPSQGLLIIAGLIMLVAFYSFILRGGNDD